MGAHDIDVCKSSQTKEGVMYVKTMKNRLSALVVALVMMLSLFSVGAMAWSTGEGIDVYWNDEKVGTVT